MYHFLKRWYNFKLLCLCLGFSPSWDFLHTLLGLLYLFTFLLEHSTTSKIEIQYYSFGKTFFDSPKCKQVASFSAALNHFIYNCFSIYNDMVVYIIYFFPKLMSSLRRANVSFFNLSIPCIKHNSWHLEDLAHI